MTELSEFDRGLVVGLLIGEASFGGDGKQPQVTVRMHVRHEALFGWLMERFPETRLYGPYHHGGRSYYQWMARGTALVRDVLPAARTRAPWRGRRLRRGAVRGDVHPLRGVHRARTRTPATAGRATDDRAEARASTSATSMPA